MGITAQEIDRDSFLGVPARHPTFWLPPNLVTLYTAVIAMSTLPASFTVALPQTLQAARAQAGAANVTVQVTTGATFTSAMTIVFQIVGFDENWDPITEIMSLTGTAAGTLSQSGVGLFSHVTSITVVGITGAVSGTLASFSFGIGDSAAALGTGVAIRLQHPLPGAPVTAFLIIPTGAGPSASVITPTSLSANGKHVILTGTTGYGANAISRAASVQLLGIDSRSIR
jgi:hypothetical protein